MQSVWRLNNSKKLLLFFSGWGMDEHPTAHLIAGRYDICTCFDYNSLETDRSEWWNRYDEITVVGWSMGVWAAEQVLTRLNLPIRQAIAINGTPKPVDNTRGIPEAVAQATLDGLTPESLRRFYRRMLGSGTLLKEMEEAGNLPVIDFDERKEELRRIIDRRPYADSGFCWHKALVGTGDAIFPPANMCTAWQGQAEVIELDAPHYPFHLFKTWEEITCE